MRLRVGRCDTQSFLSNQREQTVLIPTQSFNTGVYYTAPSICITSYRFQFTWWVVCIKSLRKHSSVENFRMDSECVCVREIETEGILKGVKTSDKLKVKRARAWKHLCTRTHFSHNYLIGLNVKPIEHWFVCVCVCAVSCGGGDECNLCRVYCRRSLPALWWPVITLRVRVGKSEEKTGEREWERGQLCKEGKAGTRPERMEGDQ